MLPEVSMSKNTKYIFQLGIYIKLSFSIYHTYGYSLVFLFSLGICVHACIHVCICLKSEAFCR